jgi:hypothetical protein
MKEAKVLLGIFFIVIGSIIFEIYFGTLLSFVGLFFIGAGVYLYVLVVDSLEKTKNDSLDFNIKEFF